LAFDSCFKPHYEIELKDINILLKALIQGSGFTKFEEKLSIASIFAHYKHLYEQMADRDRDYFDNILLHVLVKYNLYPGLDVIINKKNQFNFFMYIFMEKYIDIELVNHIINKEFKKQGHKFAELFKIYDIDGNTVLHHAVHYSEGKSEALLKFMQNNNINLEELIDMRNYEGDTPLMIAYKKGYSKIIELFLDYIGSKKMNMKKQSVNSLKCLAALKINECENKQDLISSLSLELQKYCST